MLKLHNSLTRKVEDFVPADPQNVTMYVCGPTVYDTPHLGNARPAVVFDVLNRVLRANYPSVEYARNITDIDDKIMDRAKANGESIETLTKRTTDEYHFIVDALNVLRPTYEPRATAHIQSIKGHIAELMLQGFAYESEGHVLFKVDAYPEHGVLSKHAQEDLQAGSRVKVADYKHNPSDFVLWKPSTTDQPGWDSPWGYGRPGWHIECSAMIGQVFAWQTIDIHGGGNDLRFPHHDCEISQYQCAHNRPLARYWVHNGMLLINGRKMAKSEGNFLTVRDALATLHPQVIRLSLLSAHYRSPLNWTEPLTAYMNEMLRLWHRSLDGIDASPERNDLAKAPVVALENDLNTPLLFATMHDLARQSREGSKEAASALRYCGELLGIDLVDNENFLRGKIGEDVETLIDQRNQARQRRDYAESDRLREVLKTMGVVLEDTPSGTTWRKL